MLKAILSFLAHYKRKEATSRRFEAGKRADEMLARAEAIDNRSKQLYREHMHKRVSATLKPNTPQETP